MLPTATMKKSWVSFLTATVHTSIESKKKGSTVGRSTNITGKLWNEHSADVLQSLLEVVYNSCVRLLVHQVFREVST